MKRDSRFEGKGATIVLKEVPVKWAKVYEPETTPWGVKQWTINAVLPDKLADELADCGMTVKVDKDGDRTIQIIRKVEVAGGKELSPPVVIDTNNKAFTELIGNGSVCNIEVFAKYTEVQKKTFLKPKLNKIRVVTHVPYTRGDDAF